MRFYAMCFIVALAACVAGKKDQAAFDRVTAKRPLLDKVRPIIMDLYPCANDTIEVWMPGAIDSVPYAVPAVNKEDMNALIDSLGMEYQGQCDEALRKAYNEARASVKIYRRKPDTIKVTIIDRTLIGAKDAEIARLNGVMQEREKKYAQFDKYKKSSGYAVLIGLLLFLAVVVRYIIKKFKIN
jgi:hypothetical protein